MFCRVIDNHGDLGVCLRLGRDLVSRGAQVRMWCDDPSALQWMQPGLMAGLDILPWPPGADFSAPADVGDVVIEAFGCDLPAPYLSAMAARRRAPVWINLEYLSAEPYVERSHGLQSPQFSGPAKGLNKWFFYPGFTGRTGGLLREPSLLAHLHALDAPTTHAPPTPETLNAAPPHSPNFSPNPAAIRPLADRPAHDKPAHKTPADDWLTAHGWAPRPGERVLSLFAYPHAAWDHLLNRLTGPWLLLLCPGAAPQQVPPLLRPGQRCIALPYLSQTDYDRLLQSCDFNLVRGEDSFVRAQWAGRPMLWQIYFQDDGAHSPKLQAFLDLAWADAAPGTRAAWASLHRAWNGLGAWDDAAASALADLDGARLQAVAWRAKLMEQPDLVTQLMGFALGKAGVSG
ncbi:elongation factor P maturation arginine rhamnosyltransferase EarP [Roseateles sp. SL47]|uniref:elongation factor P maturation arginine rhamnosyltransferase EarP n=1 Tax=Roseateles sp. SL47 TaxID=2995138 RepID=UPI003B63DD55